MRSPSISAAATAATWSRCCAAAGSVVAVDAEPEALRQLQARPLPARQRLTPIVARLEDVPLPIGLSLVNSSFAMPLCEPEAIPRPVGAHPRSVARRRPLQRPMVWPARQLGRTAGMTFVGRDEALALLDGFELEMFEEEEADGTTPRGNAKHWHIFHIVARK